MSAARKKKPAGPTPVESTRHSDTRVNIPTGELADFVADAEKQPTSVLYPSDPTLDPQLVWKGKDDQDLAEYLEVAAVPVYIQEKIDPRALVENLRQTAGGGADEPELTLFDDFDGLEFDQLVDFYAHEGNWSNRLILGDALLAMNSLAEKENLRAKVQMVYVDPPYGIRFGSNWQVSTRKREVSDGKDVDLAPNQRGVGGHVASVREVLGFDRGRVDSNEVYRPGLDGRAVPGDPLRATTRDRLVAHGYELPALHR